MKLQYIMALVFSVWFTMPAMATGIQCPDGAWHDSYDHCSGSPKPVQPVQPAQPNTAVGVGVGIGQGGQGGSGGSGGNATGGTSFGGNQNQNATANSGANARTGNISVNNNSRAAASSAIAPNLGGYGFPNCFGDTNPSGSFTAAFGNVFASASAGSMKASNICAIYAIGGEEAAMRYLIRMDPALRGGLFSRSAPMTVNRTTVRCPDSHPIYVEGKGCKR